MAAAAKSSRARAQNLAPLVLCLLLLAVMAKNAGAQQPATRVPAATVTTPGGAAAAAGAARGQQQANGVAAKAPEATTYTTEEKGPKDSLDYRVFFKAGGATVSPWHDIPLYAGGDGLINFVCEIPRETSAKMECATDEPNTPIKQDTKNGKLRFHPYNINWNYGFAPMTWEDPSYQNSGLKAGGDNDPVDLVEIGSEQLKVGGVYKVKPLCAYALIDEGEVDWKVVCIRADDPKAALVSDVADVEKVFPGELLRIFEWFRDYKTPEGKPQSVFGYDGKCVDRAFTMGVIEETHDLYNALKSGKRANDEELSLF